MDDTHIRSVRKVNQDSFGVTLPKQALDEINKELDVDVKSCNVVVELTREEGSVKFELHIID